MEARRSRLRCVACHAFAAARCGSYARWQRCARVLGKRGSDALTGKVGRASGARAPHSGAARGCSRGQTRSRAHVRIAAATSGLDTAWSRYWTLRLSLEQHVARRLGGEGGRDWRSRGTGAGFFDIAWRCDGWARLSRASPICIQKELASQGTKRPENPAHSDLERRRHEAERHPPRATITRRSTSYRASRLPS
jgi:hypothetical protein